MILFSQVGEPFYTYRLEKQEWKQGEFLDGFQLPFNVFDSVHGLFRRFNLWQSSHGVCLPGLTHHPFKKIGMSYLNPNPILVGDQIDQDVVIFARNRSLPHQDLWECQIDFGHPPRPHADATSIQFLETLCDAQERLTTQLLTFISDVVEQILPVCLDATGAPVVTTAALPILATLKAQHIQRLTHIMTQLRNDAWH